MNIVSLASITWKAAVVGRWTARIAGTLFALVFLTFFVGEGPPPLFRLPLRDSLIFLGLTAICAGLFLAWKWEGLGALVALAGFGVVQIDPRLGRGLLVLLPAAAAVLHLLCWARIQGGPPAPGAAWQVPRTALLVTGAVVAVFILLSANEIFGNPPLMTPAFHPPPQMQGDWHGKLTASNVDVRFTIHPDSAVTGHVGMAALTSGRIGRNRSWFGRLMHWGSEYVIQGTLSPTDRFSAPLMRVDDGLRGSIFLGRRPYRLLLARPADFAAWWRDFRSAVARRDAKTIARLAHYPLNWENGPIREIKSEADLVDHFDTYFTAEIRNIIAGRTPERLPNGTYIITWKARGNEYSLYYKPEGPSFVLDGLSEGPP